MCGWSRSAPFQSLLAANVASAPGRTTAGIYKHERRDGAKRDSLSLPSGVDPDVELCSAAAAKGIAIVSFLSLKRRSLTSFRLSLSQRLSRPLPACHGRDGSTSPQLRRDLAPMGVAARFRVGDEERFKLRTLLVRPGRDIVLDERCEDSWRERTRNVRKRTLSLAERCWVELSAERRRNS